MAFKSIERKREYDRVYNATHKEEIKLKAKEYYQKKQSSYNFKDKKVS